MDDRARVISAADGKCEQWARVPHARLLECKKRLEDRQDRSRVYVLLGDVEPVAAVLDGNFGPARTVFLRADEEMAGGDLRPIEGSSIRPGCHRRDA